MAVRLNPYLLFAGTAREAITFYGEVFGGEPQIMTFGQTGAEGELADKVMHGMLEAPGAITLMVSDLPPGEDLRPGNDVTVSLSGDDRADLTRCWERLSEGGQVETPLERQVWGDDFGMCTDRFGTRWMVNIAGTA